MAGKKIWFGNVEHAQWAPAPATGMQVVREGRHNELEFDNGGVWVDRSAAKRMSYQIDIPVMDSADFTAYEVYQRFDAGEYGDDFVRFIDPMIQDQNILSANWASPALAEQGWKPIYDTTPTFTDTGANSYGLPNRKAVYNITTAANAVPTGQNSVYTALIPDGYTLHIGGAGQVTGTAILRIQPILLNGTNDTPVTLTLAADASAPAFTQTFSGATHRAVKIYLTRTSSAASTATMTALWMQVLPTGQTAVITRHIPGKGHTGLSFRGSTAGETYVMAGRHLAGASFGLVEVEQWQ
jgi:hypothetical protein